jgi:hypothetical protein
VIGSVSVTTPLTGQGVLVAVGGTLTVTVIGSVAGSLVGASVGSVVAVGAAVALAVGASVGSAVALAVGSAVALAVGASVGSAVGVAADTWGRRGASSPDTAISSASTTANSVRPITLYLLILVPITLSQYRATQYVSAG